MRNRRARVARRAATVVVVGAVAGLAAIPALGAGSPPPPAALCPTAPATSTTQVAGYNLTALAAGFRYQLNSPGLVPFGDANVGNLYENDTAYSQTLVSQGPLVHAVSSPQYPGDSIAHLGTALATFGAPPVVPNYPVVAEADYPPAPGHGADVSFNPPPAPGLDGFTAESTADVNGGTASAYLASANLPGLSGGSSDTRTATHLQTSCVDASATSHTGAIELAGIVSIGSVTSSVSAKTDGATAVPQASLTIGKVTVAGVAASIDRDGIHISNTAGGAGVVAALEAQLQKALGGAGITVKLIAPTTSVAGAVATADSGGLDITYGTRLPGIGTPPAGTPPIPLNTELVYGAARVSVDATAAPVFTPLAGPPPSTPTLTLPPGGSGGTGGGPSTGSVVLGGSSVAPVSTGTGGTSPAVTSNGPGGSVTLVADSPTRPPLGSSIPIGWLIIGVFGCIVMVGPLLGYARWQLLEGRI